MAERTRSGGTTSRGTAKAKTTAARTTSTRGTAKARATRGGEATSRATRRRPATTTGTSKVLDQANDVTHPERSVVDEPPPARRLPTLQGRAGHPHAPGRHRP